MRNHEIDKKSLDSFTHPVYSVSQSQFALQRKVNPVASCPSKIMNIHRALSDIAEIRAQLDRTETYRGFRSLAVGVSVALLLVGAWLEQAWVADPIVSVDRYLTVWFCVAIASATLALVEMSIRARVSENELVGKMHWSLARQISPSLLVGFVLTLVIVAHAREQPTASAGLMWSLPGVWSMIYGLGLFSCHKHLPSQTLGVAVYFLFAGILLLAHNWSTRELAGWQMIASFGVGQTCLAIVLFWNLERRRHAPEK